MNKQDTQCVHPLLKHRNLKQGVTAPIYTSAAYPYSESEELVYPGFFSTENQKRLGEIIAKLEDCKWGVAYNSGMAAITAAILALIKQNDHVIFSRHVYGGTWRFVNEELLQRGVSFSFVDNKLSEIQSCVQKNTKIIFLETPSNPLLNITDLKVVATWAKKKNIITMVDNTFATPLNQQPAHLGIDVVIHSGTKYLGGHDDLPFGAVTGMDAVIKEKLLSLSKLYGGAPSPFTCYWAERSIKTLSLRVQKHNGNAMQIAKFLEAHPMIKRVYYPGLKSHPEHDIAKKQMTGGFGGMLSFELADKYKSPKKFMATLSLITPALSLGGVESLICEPAATSHKNLSKEDRLKIGVSDTLFRLSVGIENADDLIQDLKTALDGR